MDEKEDEAMVDEPEEKKEPEEEKPEIKADEQQIKNRTSLKRDSMARRRERLDNDAEKQRNLDILKNQKKSICIAWSDRTILFQLFWGVAVMFCAFSAFYMFFLYLALNKYQLDMINGINLMLYRVGTEKFDIVMMATMSMIKDHFKLTRQLIEKENTIIIDRLEAGNSSGYIHPVEWDNYVPKSKD